MATNNDAKYEDLCNKMIEAEQHVINDIPNKTLDNLVTLFHLSNAGILESSERIEYILGESVRSRKYGEEVIFSTCRLSKAILAEIEYRIKEKII
jgi:hypothetical protein